MGKLPDWEKRLGKLYVSTSAIKNLIRLDWSKKSRERKDKYNKRVGEVIEYAKGLNKDYYEMTDFIGKLSGQYINDHVDVSKRINDALKNAGSIQTDLKKFSDQAKGAVGAMGSANKNFDRAGINIKNCKYGPLKGAPKYASAVKAYRDSIDRLRKSISTCEKNIADLERMRNLKKLELNLQETMRLSAMASDGAGSLQALSISTQIASLEREIGAINRKINDEKKNKEEYIKQLSDLDKKIVEHSNKIIAHDLAGIRTFVGEMQGFINYQNGQLKKLESRIAKKSEQGGILSQDELQEFTNNVNAFPEKIKSLQKLADAGAKENDYGEGFFRTISTKEKKLDELDKKLHEIGKEMEENREQMKAYRDQIAKYKDYKEDSDTEAWIREVLAPFENESKKFKEIIAKKENEFNYALSQINAQVIKPFYSKDNNLLESVKEVSIVF